MAKDLNRHLSKEVIQRPQRHMKGCSASLAIREMKLKVTVGYYFTPVRMAIKQTTSPVKAVEKKEHCWWECRLVQPRWKIVRSFLKK